MDWCKYQLMNSAAVCNKAKRWAVGGGAKKKKSWGTSEWAQDWLVWKMASGSVFNSLWWISKRAQASHIIPDSTFVLARPKLTPRRLIYCIPHSDQKVLHQAVSSKDGTLLGRLNLSCTLSRTMRPGEKWTPPGSLKEGQPFPAVIHSV